MSPNYNSPHFFITNTLSVITLSLIITASACFLVGDFNCIMDAYLYKYVDIWIKGHPLLWIVFFTTLHCFIHIRITHTQVVIAFTPLQQVAVVCLLPRSPNANPTEAKGETTFASNHSVSPTSVSVGEDFACLKPANMPLLMRTIASRAAPVLRAHSVTQRATVYTRPAKEKIGPLVSLRSLYRFSFMLIRRKAVSFADEVEIKRNADILLLMRTSTYWPSHVIGVVCVPFDREIFSHT